MTHLVYFPQSIQELQKEVLEHPELMEQLGNLEDWADYGDKIGVVAAFVNVVLEGWYGQKDLELISEKLVEKLRMKRQLDWGSSDSSNLTTSEEIPKIVH